MTLATPLRRLATLLLCSSVSLLTLTSCTELDAGPNISSVTITPDTIKKSDTGMTDEFFEVTITTTGFTSTITDATVSIQDVDPPLQAQPLDAIEIQGDVIRIDKIPKSWFGGFDPGTYQLEVTVTSEETQLTEGSVASVTIQE